MTAYSLNKSQLNAANAKPAPEAAPKVAPKAAIKPVRLAVYGFSGLVVLRLLTMLPAALNAPAPAPVAATPAPVEAPVAAAPAPEPTPVAAPSARYDAKERYINNVMLKAARNNLERCRQTYDQGDALGYAMCENQREVYEYARNQM